MRYALIVNGVVSTVVEQDSLPTTPGTWVEALNAGPGYTYDGTSFAPPVVAPDLRITKLSFRNRFTTAEKVALYTQAKTSVEIQIYLDDIQAVLSQVDLANAKTIESVNSLEAVGILAPGRAAEILNTLPEPHEQMSL